MRESAENHSTYTKGVYESRHVLLFGISINVQSLFIQVHFRAALISNFTDYFKYQVLLLNVQYWYR